MTNEELELKIAKIRIDAEVGANSYCKKWEAIDSIVKVVGLVSIGIMAICFSEDSTYTVFTVSAYSIGIVLLIPVVVPLIRSLWVSIRGG